MFAGLAPLIGRTTFEIRLEELEPNAELRRDGYRIATFGVDHGVPAHGYALIEDERPGHLDPAARPAGDHRRPRPRAAAAGRGGRTACAPRT